MTILTDNERSLRSYLLGEAKPDEQRQIEERLLLDADYVELLVIIEEELVDDYVSNTLPEGERKQFEKHFLTTPKRLHKLKKAKALRRYINKAQPIPVPTLRRESRSKVFWRHPHLTPDWRRAIAAMIMLGFAVGVWRVFLYQSLADKGRAALQAALRESPTEARIAGFHWTPKSGTLGSQPNDAASLSMERAFSYFRDAIDEQPGPDSHYALGQFYLAKGEPDKAIQQFNQALEGMPKNAKLHSDLGVALLEMAKRETAKDLQGEGSDNGPTYLFQSLEHLNRALELDDSLLEALFNRALCYERMQLPQAEAEWRAYLSRDANSPWADEAKRHLENIEVQKQKTAQNDKGQFKEFLNAYETGDRPMAWKVISQTREMITGRPIWWRLLNGFFRSEASRQFEEANGKIEALRYVGKLELNLGEEDGKRQGDPYISELAEFYSTTSQQQRRGLAEAHKLINKGNRFYLKNKYDDAVDKYAQARNAFALASNEGEVMLTHLLISNSYIRSGDMKRSALLLEPLVNDCRKKQYLWLLAQSFFSLAMAQDGLGEYSKALTNTEQSLQISEEINDSYNIQRSLAQIADQYKKLGNYELATTYLNRCLKQASAAWPGARQMWRTCDQLTQVLRARRLDDAAAAYAKEALRLALEMNDPSFVYISYVHSGMIQSKQQDYAEAIKLVQRGLDVAPDAFCTAYASLQLGHLHSQAGQLDKALSDYDQAIKYIEMEEADPRNQTNPDAARAKTNRLRAFSYDAHKGRLFCLLAQRDDVLVEEELKLTMELLEKHRKSILEEQNRNTFFNVEQSVYDAAMDFEQSKSSDNPAVFDYSEESRARSLLDLIATARARSSEADGLPRDIAPQISNPLDLAEVQGRLPDQMKLIEYVVLDNKLLICVVSKSDFSVREVKIRLSELTDKVSKFRRSILLQTTEVWAQGQELYDSLIKPIELSPGSGEQICIVPDKVLNNLPFAALISSGSERYLIQDYQLTVAPSATIYLVCSELRNRAADRDQERLLAVGNPAFDSKMFDWLPPIPSTGQQVEKIAGFYQSPKPLVLTDDDAREEAVKRGMEESDVIHLASHYDVSEGDPMNSKLMLAKEPDDGREHGSTAGFLQADEVYGLKLRRAPLVILSACQSGVERYYSGEGMIGMSRAFIAAGATTVVASLWPVDVYATDKLMADFHLLRKLKRLSASEALRRAQVDMLGGTSKKHPYYWAGFTAIGGHPDA